MKEELYKIISKKQILTQILKNTILTSPSLYRTSLKEEADKTPPIIKVYRFLQALESSSFGIGAQK